MTNLWTFFHDHPTYTLAAVGITASIVAFFHTWLRQLADFAMKTALGAIFVRKEVSDDFTCNLIVYYLVETGAKQVSISRQRYDASKQKVPALEASRIVMKRLTAASHVLFKWKGRLIYLSPSAFTSSGAARKQTDFGFLRGTINWERLLCDAAKLWDERFLMNQVQVKKHHFEVIRHAGSVGKRLQPDSPPATGSKGDSDNAAERIAGEAQLLNYSKDDFRPIPKEAPFENLCISPQMQSVLETVRFWFGHRAWYLRRGLAWRRGYLLHGKPGNGKTSLVRAIAEELDIPVHVFDLASMDNSDFLDAWANSRAGGEARICLLEDFDTVFHLRENVLKDSPLTFETILNVIDGVEREDGLLLFVTTNVVTAIDPAMGCPDEDNKSSRPGRIDRVVEIPAIDFEGRLKMAIRILEDDVLAREMAETYTEDTSAQFQERCVAEALKQLWDTRREA